MADLVFPSSPAISDTYSSNGLTWVWDGETWNVVSQSLTSSTTFSGDVFGTYSNLRVVDDSHTHAAINLTGTTLASNVTGSSLTSVGTLSSLSVSGNLTVDTNTLFVDATNNEVGIGTTNPSAKLDVVGDAEINGNIVVSGTVDSRDVASDGSSLDTLNGTTSGGAITRGSGIVTIDIGGTAGTARPVNADQVYWICNVGITPTNAVEGDLIYNRAV